MTEASNAETLRISDGFVVWIVGTTVEGTSLLDPLPEGAEMIEVRDEDEPESVDAAVLVADDRVALADRFDEVLPRLGSIPLVWISYRIDGSTDLDEDAIQELVADYGWFAEESVVLDESWAALRIDQS